MLLLHYPYRGYKNRNPVPKSFIQTDLNRINKNIPIDMTLNYC